MRKIAKSEFGAGGKSDDVSVTLPELEKEKKKGFRLEGNGINLSRIQLDSELMAARKKEEGRKKKKRSNFRSQANFRGTDFFVMMGRRRLLSLESTT